MLASFPSILLANDCTLKAERNAAQQQLFMTKIRQFTLQCVNFANPRGCRKLKMTRYCSVTSETGDSDLDGDRRSLDNCPLVPNSDQADTDLDLVGNVCDNAPAVPNNNQADSDLDAVADVLDNCPSVVNTNQLDEDTDGTGNACEVLDLVVLPGDYGSSNCSEETVLIYNDVMSNTSGVGGPSVSYKHFIS